MDDAPDTQELRALETERRAAAEKDREEATTEHEALTAERRAEKAAYLADRLGEAEEAEKRS